MTQDNPSPEMVQARKDVIARCDATLKDAADAWHSMRKAYDTIGESASHLTGPQREKLYRDLDAAQADFESVFTRHEKAYEAAKEYFQPLASGDDSV